MRGRLERVSYVLRGCFVVGVSQFTFILPSEEPASRIRKSPLGGAGLAQGAAGTIKWFCNHRPAQPLEYHVLRLESVAYSFQDF